MARTKRGWLRAEALRSGYREQHAVVIEQVRHTVELLHDGARGGFVTTYRVDSGRGLIEAHEWQVSTNLPLAREKFEECVARIAALTLESS